MNASSTELPDWLKRSSDRPIVVFGQGSSGQAARDLLQSLGMAVNVIDQKHADPQWRVFDAERARGYSVAICSPGFPFDHPWLGACREAGVEIVPEGDLGACFWKGPIVAITGTNGKTTLTEFLTLAFNSAGMEAYACGNIGRPLSRLLVDDCNPEAIAVCEVSSFQAEISRRLHVDALLWTNFDEDHLDRHGSLEKYFDSKYKLFEQMEGEVCFFDQSVLDHAGRFGRKLPEGGIIDPTIDPAAIGIAGTLFETEPELSTYLLARRLWLQWSLSEGELIEAAHSFKKSPHRMELIASRKGITYWDDSKATNFHAVFGALRRFQRPVIWIGGGKDKGGDVGKFVGRLAPFLESAHLIGETAPRLAEIFKEHGVPSQVYSGLDEAVAGATARAETGSNILLSPGFASLDMFESYSQRGEVFRKAINSLEFL